MQSKPLNNRGFGLISVLIILLLILVVGAGIYVYHNDHKTTPANHKSTGKTSSNSAAGSSTVIYSADKKIQVTLPSSWQIIDTNGSSNPKQVIGTSTNPTCFTVTDSHPCLYTAYFAPKAFRTTLLWTLSVEKSTQTPQQIIELLIGQPQAANILASSTNKINGYDAYYMEYKNPNTHIYYVVAHKGYIVLFENGQLKSQPNPSLNNPNSPYLTDFKNIVDSVKLNF